MILLSFGSSFWSRLELISCVFLSYLTTDMAEYWHWHACAVKGSTFVCFHSVGRKKSYCQGFIPVARSTNNEYRPFFFSSFNQRIWGKQSWVWRYLKVRGRKKEPILRNLSQTKQIISATVSLPYFSGGKKVCKVSFYEVLSAIVCVSPLRNHIWPVKLHFYHVQSKVPWI